jgi:transcription antitermination factor NusG
MHSPNSEARCVSEVMPAGWYAVYTRHQHEKSAAEILTNKGFEVLLPLYRTSHRWKDRKQAVLLPLFRSYLFIQANLGHRLEILRTPGVCWLVSSAGAPVQLPDREVEMIRKLATGPVSYQPHPFLTTGERVRVIRGPLYGLEGILTRVKTHDRVVLSVELLQRSAAVELDLDSLERIHSHGLSASARNN